MQTCLLDGLQETKRKRALAISDEDSASLRICGTERRRCRALSLYLR
jgi:hypothetical protein